MSGITGILSRKRITGIFTCEPPTLYVGKNNTASSATQIYPDMYYNTTTNKFYFFANTNLDSATLTWTIRISDPGSGTQVNYSGTTTITQSRTLFGSSNGYNMASGGYARITYHISCNGYEDSPTLTTTVYRTKQNLVVTFNPTSTSFPYAGIVDIYANYNNCNIYYNKTESNSGTPSTPAVPTMSSTLYEPGEGIIVSRNTKIRAKAFDIHGIYNDSTDVTCTYTITSPGISQPIFVTPGGSGNPYSNVVSVEIRNPNSFGDIYYTISESATGNIPDSNSTRYNGPFNIASSCYIKARVIEPITGNMSVVAQTYYLIESEPTISAQVISVTGNTIMVKGTLVYNSDVYLLQNAAPIVGFYIGDTPSFTNVNPIWLNDPDLSGNDNTVITTVNDTHIATRTFYYCIDVNSTSTTKYISPIAKLYYFSGGSFFMSNTLYFNTSVKTVTPSVPYITGTTLSSARGTYPIIDGSVYGGFESDSFYNYHHNIKCVLSPVNLSFYTQSDSNGSMKSWGAEKVTQEYTINTATSAYTGTITSYNYNKWIIFMRQPWSFIGDSSSYCLSAFDPLGGLHHSHPMRNNSGNKDHIRDLFGWGASFNDRTPHQDCWQPWSVSTIDSSYNAYDSATADLRNVRSDFYQCNPAEPNSSYYSGTRTYPLIYGDFGTSFTSIVKMVSLFGNGPYDPPSWRWGESPQGCNALFGSSCRHDTRAYTFLSQDNYNTNSDGNMPPKICTLSDAEWRYMVLQRSGNRFAKGMIECEDYYNHSTNNINGLFLFSSTTPNNIINMFRSINEADEDFRANVISENDWNSNNMENWVTFLPAAGYRTGTTCYQSNSDGYYWSRTHASTTNAYCLHFNNSTVEILSVPKSRGCSVRLARYIYSRQ